MNEKNELTRCCPIENRYQFPAITKPLEDQDDVLSWWLINKLKECGWEPFAITANGKQILGYCIYHFRSKEISQREHRQQVGDKISIGNKYAQKYC